MRNKVGTKKMKKSGVKIGTAKREWQE